MGFECSWVCNCGCPWHEHETVLRLNQPILEMGREWVAGGLRPDVKKEAEEKRAIWANKAATIAARKSKAEASKYISKRSATLSTAAEGNLHTI